MKKYIIETYDLCKKGGRRFRVKDVNLAIPKGCIYGFLGPNGAGKTTTMKLLLRLIQFQKDVYTGFLGPTARVRPPQ